MFPADAIAIRLCLLTGLVLIGGGLGAAERPPQDPANSTNLYHLIKRLKEQPQIRQRPRVNRYELGYQRIQRMLGSIRFQEVVFDGLTLDEVIQYLAAEIRKKDPEKRGVNFMYVGQAATPTPPNGAASVAAPPVAGIARSDLAGVVINLRQPMRNLTVLQVLDVVAKTADQPIMFAVNDYAVVAMPKTPGSANVVAARFRANPDTFLQGMPNITRLPLPVVGNRTDGD